MSEINTVTKDGITMKIDRIIITEDRLAVSVVGSRDDGKYIGESILGRGYTWDWHGMDESIMNGYGQIPSINTKKITWSFVSPYNILNTPAYGTFKIKDLAYQRPATAKWIVSNKGSWKLCFSIEQTDTTTSYSINKELLAKNTQLKVNNLRLDIL